MAKRGPKGPSKPMDDAMFRQLLAMIKIHCTQDEICGMLNMSEPTLDSRCKERGFRNFLDLLRQKRAAGKVSLRRMGWKACEEGNVQMIMWKSKQILGERDRFENNISIEGDITFITKYESRPQEK